MTETTSKEVATLASQYIKFKSISVTSMEGEQLAELQKDIRSMAASLLTQCEDKGGFLVSKGQGINKSCHSADLSIGVDWTHEDTDNDYRVEFSDDYKTYSIYRFDSLIERVGHAESLSNKEHNKVMSYIYERVVKYQEGGENDQNNT